MRTLSSCAALLLLVAAPLAAQAPDPKKAEAAVKAYIFDNADDPDSVKLVKWGPHDLDGKTGLTLAHIEPYLPLAPSDLSHLNTSTLASLGRLQKVAGKGPLPLARVRYRLKNKAGALELHDVLFVLKAGEVIPLCDNRAGDAWVTRLAEALKSAEKGKKKEKKEGSPTKELPPKVVKHKEGDKRLPGEEAVIKYILARARKPKAIKLLEWGPHDLEGKLGADWRHQIAIGEQNDFIRLLGRRWTDFPEHLRQLGKPPYPLVRLRWQFGDLKDGPLDCDWIFAVKDGKVALFARTFRGRLGYGDWQAPMRGYIRMKNTERLP